MRLPPVLLPRVNRALQFTQTGWVPITVAMEDIPAVDIASAKSLSISTRNKTTNFKSHPYSIFPSLKTDYLFPDIFVDTETLKSDCPLPPGMSQTDMDGMRVFDILPITIIYSWRLGARAQNFSARATRYPFGYTTGRNDPGR